MSERMVIYHGGCYDGFGAAWAAHCSPLWKDAEFVPMGYGKEPPDADGKTVLIGDFSFPRATLLKMQETAHSVRVYDHHKTAQDDLSGLDFATFDMDRSGAVIVWSALHPDKPVPKLLEYIQDRDLWRFKLTASKEATAFMRSHPMTFEMFDALAAWFESNKSFSEIVPQGGAILRYQDTLVADAVTRAREITIAGHKVLASNYACLFSEVADALIKDRPFGVCWSEQADGRVMVSLRSRPGFDVSAIAKMFGGGGHPTAAGCQPKRFEDICEVTQ